ncbi:MAG TPA: OST-HTH/LOTUS domain-containing protein, partial [Gemmatimonadaceae bacterium]|nr:OST-HTH/LOTUS domain-containing protein [Gemmatimonadaceae bacterium]
STFSEREYGAGSFRDFMEKVAQTGAVELKHHGRSMLVEAVATESSAVPVAPPAEAVDGAEASSPAAAASVNGAASPDLEADTEEEETLPASPMSMQDGIKAVQHAFSNAGQIRWPMYVRQARQFLRTAIQGFDERKYGFASVVDLLRAAGKEGVFRIERDRQGAVRVFPGANLQPKAAPMDGLPVDMDETIDVEVPTELVADASFGFDQPTIEGAVDPVALPEPEMAAADLAEPSMDDDEVIDDDGPQPGNSIHEPPSHSRGRKTKAAAPPRSRSTRAPRSGAAKTARPRARKPKPS